MERCTEQACGKIDPVGLIFHDKLIRGFYLGNWFRESGPLRILRAAGRVQKMLIDGRLETKIQRRLKLEEAAEGLTQYVQNMTAGKVLFTSSQ